MRRLGALVSADGQTAGSCLPVPCPPLFAPLSKWPPARPSDTVSTRDKNGRPKKRSPGAPAQNPLPGNGSGKAVTLNSTFFLLRWAAAPAGTGEKECFAISYIRPVRFRTLRSTSNQGQKPERLYLPWGWCQAAERLKKGHFENGFAWVMLASPKFSVATFSWSLRKSFLNCSFFCRKSDGQHPYGRYSPFGFCS